MQVLQSWCDAKANKSSYISLTAFYTSFITILQQVISLYHKGAKKQTQTCSQKHIPDPTVRLLSLMCLITHPADTHLLSQNIY